MSGSGEEVVLVRRFDFCASHVYRRPEWSEEENRRVFGPCSNPRGHGHNYVLEVAVRGLVARETGMVVNLSDLKRIVEGVLEEFDHRNLNEDTPYFRERIPTTENLAAVLWDRIAGKLLKEWGGGTRLCRIVLHEDEDLRVEYARDADA